MCNYAILFPVLGKMFKDLNIFYDLILFLRCHMHDKSQESRERKFLRFHGI